MNAGAGTPGSGSRERRRKRRFFTWSSRITRGLVLICIGLGVGFVATSDFCLGHFIGYPGCLLGMSGSFGVVLAAGVVGIGGLEISSGLIRGVRRRRPHPGSSRLAHAIRDRRRRGPRDTRSSKPHERSQVDGLD